MIHEGYKPVGENALGDKGNERVRHQEWVDETEKYSGLVAQFLKQTQAETFDSTKNTFAPDEVHYDGMNPESSRDISDGAIAEVEVYYENGVPVKIKAVLEQSGTEIFVSGVALETLLASAVE